MYALKYSVSDFSETVTVIITPTSYVLLVMNKKSVKGKECSNMQTTLYHAVTLTQTLARHKRKIGNSAITIHNKP